MFKSLKRRPRRLWRSLRINILLFTLAMGLSYLVVACSGDRATEASPPVQTSPPTELSQATGSPSCGSSSSGPTDNPVMSRYAEQSLAWTNDIQWSCVYNINDFEGSTDLDRFNAARDAATANGGGVVYLPADTYTFTDNLLLADGVVLRGETPSSTDAKAEGYQPPTRLEFPQYEPTLSGNGTPNETAFKQILTTSPNTDSNLGLVNLDINRAAIQFISDVDVAENQNIVLFGIRSNNVAQPDASIPDSEFQAGWMRFGDRFAANIKVSALANVLIANNRLNDAITDIYEQPGYTIRSVDQKEVITYDDGSRVPFSYSDHYGIVVNRSKDGGFSYGSSPDTEPGLFREGIVIQDNWVYKTMRVGIHAAGSGLVIKGNEIRDRADKAGWADPTGKRQPRGAVTFENRAIDWAGWNVAVEDNTYEVFSHRVMDTVYQSVDGEGILIQQCCGGTSINGVTIQNNRGNSYIGLYKVPDIENVVIRNNEVLAGGPGTQLRNVLIYVSADTNNGPNSMSNVRIEDNTINGGILAKASSGGQRNIIQNNRSQGGNNSKIDYSCSVEVRDNSGFEVASCADDK